MLDTKYKTVNEMIKENRYPFTSYQFMHLMRNRHKNGLDPVVRKHENRLYIDKYLFDEWYQMSNQWEPISDERKKICDLEAFLKGFDFD